MQLLAGRVLFFAFGMVSFGCRNYAQTRYVVTPLTFSYAKNFSVTGLNDFGQLTGNYAAVDGSTHSFWFNGLTPVDLGTIDGLANVVSAAINNSSQIVGTASDAAGAVHRAFLFDHGSMTDLGVLPGGSAAAAVGINNKGDVAGNGDEGVITESRGFLIKGGVMSDIGSLGYYGAQTYGLDDLDDVVGDAQEGSQSSFGPIEAVVYRNGVLSNLGDLNGGLGLSCAQAANSAGLIVGFSDLPQSGIRHAMSDQNGVMTDLGTLGSGTTSEALGVNDQGVVVGTSWANPNGGVRAFLWEGGRMKDLSSFIEPWGNLVSTFTAYGSASTKIVFSANLINHAGQIVVQDQTGIASTPFLLTPVQPGRISNFSVLGMLGNNSPAITVGVVVAGGTKNLLLRGVGPSLSSFSVPTPLPDPQLTFFSGPVQVAYNSNWNNASNATAIATETSQIGAFQLSASSTDDALAYVAAPGIYSFQISSGSAINGAAMGEIYDLDPLTTSSRIINASGLVQVPTKGTVTAGFIISGTYGDTLIIRAVGPGLKRFSSNQTLADPEITLFDATRNIQATSLASGSDPLIAQVSAQQGAFSLDPAGNDAAIIASVKPGTYTLQVSSPSNASGQVLIEIYEVQ